MHCYLFKYIFKMKVFTLIFCTILLILYASYCVAENCYSHFNNDDDWSDELIDKYCTYSDFALKCGLKWVTFEPLGENNTFAIPKNVFIKKGEVYLKCIKILKRDKFLFGKSRDIETLEFYSNNITTIEPMMFDSFESLKVLKLSHNKIETIDETILTSKLGLTLNMLDLSSNEIHNVSSTSFINLHNLNHLDLAANKKLGEMLQNNIFPDSLANLEVLNLMFCNISKLEPNVFMNLTNLKELLLQENYLTSIPQAINSLSNLRFLNIGGSNITVLKYDPRVHNSKLEEIDLFRSKWLTEVDDCAFCNFPNLKSISFWYSQNLTKIHENAFGAVTKTRSNKIETFNIQKCNISTLSFTMLKWDSLKEIIVSDNPWRCDCSMAWFINDLKTKSSKYLSKLKSFGIVGGPLADLKCRYPLKLKGKSIYEISGNVCTIP